MAKFSKIQNNLLAGELSPKVKGRTELREYAEGCEELLNMLVIPQGGAIRRPGTQFIRSAAKKYNLITGAVLSAGVDLDFVGDFRIIPFVFSREEAYVVIIQAAGTSTTISIVNVNTDAQSAYTLSATYTFTDYIGFEQFAGYTDHAQLMEVQFAQVGDLLFLVHNSHQPYIIARTGVDVFEKQTFFPLGSLNSIARAFPYLTANTDTSNSLEITGFNGKTLTSTIPFFTSDHVGSVFKLTSGGVTHSFFIQGFTSSTSVTGDSGIGGPFGPTADWEEAAFSEKKGFPSAIAIFQQRVYYGGTTFEPDTVYASETGDLFELDAIGFAGDPGFGTVVASDPFSFTIASSEVNSIQWMSAGVNLDIGTLGREYTASGSSGGSLSALDIGIKPQTSYGSTLVQSIRAGGSLVFVQRSGLKLRDYKFNFNEDAFNSKDLTLLSDDISKKNFGDLTSPSAPQILSLSFQSSGNEILWCLNNNGGLFSLTRNEDFEILAWHHHTIGGLFSGDPAFVSSMASIPTNSSSSDEVYVMVKRTINGSPVAYLEKIGKDFDLLEVGNTSTDIDDKPVYSDSAKLVVLGSPAKVFTGYDHLEGESVDLLADGSYVGTKTVVSGAITLDSNATQLVAGLNYTSRVKLLPIEAGSVIGSAQTQIKRIHETFIRFYRTIGAKVGVRSDKLDAVEFRPTDLPMNDPIPLFTGDKKVRIPKDINRDMQIIIQQDLPLPMTILAVIQKGLTHD